MLYSTLLAIYLIYMCVKLLQSCLTLCDPMDSNLPSSSVHEILQARILEWVAMPSSKGSSYPGIKPVSLKSPALAGRSFTSNSTRRILYIEVRICQSQSSNLSLPCLFFLVTISFFFSITVAFFLLCK